MGRIALQRLPGCESITLGLIAPDFPLGPLPADVMHAVIASPAYWAFCWGSGLGLARMLLAQPSWVADRTVLDLGAGSGVVGIAAKRAGARRVIACDTDLLALEAVRVNAAINAVEIETIPDLSALAGRVDIVLMADVLYDKSNLPLLSSISSLCGEMLVADSRIKSLPEGGYRLIEELNARTFPNLGEFDEFATVRVFHRTAA